MAQEPLIGAIFMFAGNFAPRGYALCNGQTMSISQNAALFSILGTFYGGNGTTTFQLPNLQGRVPVGVGNGAGLTPISIGEVGGVQSVTLNASTMPIHTHSATVTINAANDGRPSTDNPSGAVLDSTGGNNIYASAPDGTKMNSGMATAVVSPTGGSQPFSIQNPYVGINYIIALVGVFPTRN